MQAFCDTLLIWAHFILKRKNIGQPLKYTLSHIKNLTAQVKFPISIDMQKLQPISIGITIYVGNHERGPAATGKFSTL